MPVVGSEPSNNYSTQSTPTRSSCVTVPDSDEDYKNRHQQAGTPTCKSTTVKSEPYNTLSRKNRILAKAQSELMISSMKEESNSITSSNTLGNFQEASGPSSSASSRGNEDSNDVKEQKWRQEYLEQQLRDRERDHSHTASRERDYAAALTREARERELVSFQRGIELGPPPIAHQSNASVEYAQAVARGASTVEYIQPPAAHSSNQASAGAQPDVLRAAQQYRHTSPTAAAAAHHQADLYAAAAALFPGAAAPTTVYVTTAGYHHHQQIAAIQPPPAHHGRQVLAQPTAAPPAHPLPAHMPSPAHAAAAAAASLFHAPYGYAPLSPGKTRYLY